MNILVTGSYGQLGSSIRIMPKIGNHNYFYTDVDTLDICDSSAVKDYVEANNIDIIVNCAAYTNVDKAEEDSERSLVFKVNTEAVRNLALAMKQVDGLLIHISTDYVFGGNFNNTPCTEEQRPNPTGVYGQSKLNGEKEIEKSGCKFIILRTAWLYSEYGHNFVKTMFNLTASRPELKVVFDQCGTPTYAWDLAYAIIDIIENDKFCGNEGIYHYSNEGVCSWYDFAKMIQMIAGNSNCIVKPCHSDEFPSKVMRPSYSVLDKTKFKNTFGKEIPYWTTSLTTCITNLLEMEN